MRKALAEREDERAMFRGVFERFGSKLGWQGSEEKTVLLSHIVDNAGMPVCDHLWFNFTKGFAAVDLQPGDVVEFDARVTPYVKGYQGQRWDVYKPTELDYKLSYPTRIRKVSHDTRTDISIDG